MNEKMDSSQLADNVRVAAIAEVDGDPVGVCIHLTPTDLRHLAVDPSETDEVTYSIDTTTDQLSVRDTRAGDRDG